MAQPAESHSFTASQFHSPNSGVRGVSEIECSPLIRLRFCGPKLRFGQSVYPRGEGGGGVPLFALIPYIPGRLALKKCVLYRTYVHICCIGSNEHLPQKEAATRMGIAAFLLLLLKQFYALEGYRTARVRGGIEPLVTGVFRFGNGRESTSQRVGGKEAGKGRRSRTRSSS